MCIVLSVTLGLQAELTDQQNAEPSIISIPPPIETSSRASPVPDIEIIAQKAGDGNGWDG